MDQVTSKILELQKKIEQIGVQSKKVEQDVIQAKQSVAVAENELRECRLTCALEKTPANEKTVEGARARLDQAKKELEDLEFLKEALTRKNPEIQADLMSAQRDLARLEVMKLCAMTPDLIDAYNISLRQNFDFLCKLKVIIDAVGERCGLPELRMINEHLGLALRQLPENLTLCEFKGRMGGVDMQVLSYGKINKKALLNTLLN